MPFLRSRCRISFFKGGSEFARHCISRERPLSNNLELRNMIHRLLFFCICFIGFVIPAFTTNPAYTTAYFPNKEDHEASAMSIDLTTTIANCNQWGTATATVTGGAPAYTYSWSGPGNFTSSEAPTVYDLPPGLYTLIVTDATGTTATKSFTISGNVTNLSVSATGYPPSCYNIPVGSIVVNAYNGSGDYTYQWSNGVTTSNGEVNNVTPGDPFFTRFVPVCFRVATWHRLL